MRHGTSNTGHIVLRKSSATPKREFPGTLANVVFKKWNSLVSGDYVAPICPPKQILKELFEIAYITAGVPEEDRYPQFNIVVSPLDDTERAGQLGQIWSFTERRPLTVSNLHRLAPAADLKKSAVWVQWSASKLYISGLVDLGTSWGRAKIGLEYQYKYPRCLLVQIERPGRMRVYQSGYHVATLSDGTIEGHESFGFHLSLHEPTHRGLETMGDEIIRPQIESQKDFLEFEFMALWNTYAAIVNSIALLKHGGALIIAPSNEGASEHVRIKYKQNSPVLHQCFIKFINCRHIIGDIIARRESGELISDDYFALAEIRSRKSFDDLVEATRFVANLSGCDGAIVISNDLQLSGFGAEITAETAKDIPVFEAIDFYHEANRQYRQLDLQQFGMRHRSAIKLVSREPEIRVLVASQDGPISSIWSDRDKVIVRRGVNLVNINMPWA